MHCVWARKGDADGVFTSCITCPQHVQQLASSSAATSPDSASAAAAAAAAASAAVHDGCVCAWDPHKFEYIRHQVIALPSPSSKPGVAVMTLLKPKPLQKVASSPPSTASREFPPLGFACDSDSPRTARRKAAVAAVAAREGGGEAERGGGRGEGGGGGGGGGGSGRSAEPLRPLLVVTSHIVWNSKRGDVKLRQLCVVIALPACFVTSREGISSFKPFKVYAKPAARTKFPPLFLREISTPRPQVPFTP